jgi:hypothetical protein
MKIQINSDRTIEVDAILSRFAKDEVGRGLGRFAAKLTRVELHLSDVNSRETGRPDKRCLIEARPSADKPFTASATAMTTESAITQTTRKMQRLLTSFFGRKGRSPAEISSSRATSKKARARKTGSGVNGTDRTTERKKSTKLSPRGPKKKGIYQARRKARSQR